MNDEKQASTPEESRARVRSASEEFRRNKGVKPKGMNDAALEVLGRDAAVTLASEVDVKEVLSDLTWLPPKVIAGGVCGAWKDLPPELKSKLKGWIEEFDPGKSQKIKADMLRGLIEADPAYGRELFRQLPVSNKELRRRIAATLFQGELVGARLLLAGVSSHKEAVGTVTRLLELMDVVELSTEETKASLLGILRQVVGLQIDRDSNGISALEKIGVRVRALPLEDRRQLHEFVAEQDQAFADKFLPVVMPEQPAETSAMPTVEGSRTAPALASPVGEPAETIHLDTSAIIKAAEGQAFLLRQQASVLDSLVTQVRELESSLQSGHREKDEEKRAKEAAEKKALQLEEDLGESRRRSDAAEASLRQREERLGKVEADLRAAEARARSLEDEKRKLDSHVDQLHERVGKNATQRLEEFKSRVADTLSKQLSGIPARAASIDAEQGKRVLIVLYGVIGALRREGIAVSSGDTEPNP